MDRLVDHLFVFEGDGVIRDFPGNYTLYRNEIREPAVVVEKKEVKTAPPAPAATAPAAPKRQPSFKEKREFELLEKEMKELTKERTTVTEKLNSGDTPFEELQKMSVRIGEIEQLLNEKEFRWLELSEII